MGNTAVKEGGGGVGAEGKQKRSMGDLIRQGSMPGDGGKKSVDGALRKTISLPSSHPAALVRGVGTAVDIREESREGSWPPFAVSSVQGMRKGMEDEFYAGGEVGFPSSSSCPHIDLWP